MSERMTAVELAAAWRRGEVSIDDVCARVAELEAAISMIDAVARRDVPLGEAPGPGVAGLISRLRARSEAWSAALADAGTEKEPK